VTGAGRILQRDLRPRHADPASDNCRYLGGYRRVDIPVVQDWLDTVL
jgi:hypothetical protein